MIACHCRTIPDRDIHAAIDWMRAADPGTIMTLNKDLHVRVGPWSIAHLNATRMDEND